MTTQPELNFPHAYRTDSRSRWVPEEISAENHEPLAVMARFSHELRNSLGAIRNATQLLGTGLSGSAAALAQGVIVRQVEQMTRLVDDVLDVSRIRNGQLRLRRDRIDLCTVVSHSIQTVKFTMQQRNHRLSVSFPETPLWLHGDPDRLEQVFVNLLINAAKYTDPGGRVDVSVHPEGPEAVVRVRDTGVGIEAAVLAHVFDLYVQGNASSRGGGLGLGLPLVRSLVERHGGLVTAASAGPGKGSEFTIRLPLLTNPGHRAAASMA